MTGPVPRRAVDTEPAGAEELGGVFDPVVISRVLAIAGRAPSLHNTQPWTWRLERDRLELRADRQRQLLVADPDGHSLRISCGAALALTELAFAGEGWLMHNERLPDPDQPDLLASFTAPRPYLPTTADRDQLAAAARRYSERRPFQPRPISAEVEEELRIAAEGRGVHAHFPVREQERLNLAVAVSWADRVERKDPVYLAEMHRWAHDADVHLPAFRARVQTLMGWAGCPQMMLRLGYPPPDRPPLGRSPRRSVADQLVVRQ